VTLTDRDKKIMLLLIPIVVVGAYWFLLMSPKREQASEADAALVAQESRRDLAQTRVAALSGDRSDFEADYAELVRLGKAVPTSVDMPTVLVQLEAAAAGTDIDFKRIAADEREAAAVPAATPGTGDGSAPADAGGTPAASGPGTASESAGNAVNDANANSGAAAEQSGVAPSDTQTSTPANDGSLPVGGGTAVPGATGTTGTGAPGLETVPLTLEFVGNFTDLADFFHRIKRYVETSENNVYVRGRLLTIEGVTFASEPSLFPKVTATITATAYLAPQSEGPTAGATPSGPATTPAATAGVDAATTPPTATAAPLR
jgi:Tfp pilus assembly protein PilO